MIAIEIIKKIQNKSNKIEIEKKKLLRVQSFTQFLF